MSFLGIQGHLLEVTVVGCNKLKDTEWISRQDPYVCLEYGSTKFRTTTCKDGGKFPTFQEKFTITLIEGLTELTVNVWNSNTLTYDDFIGHGKIQLQRVLLEGYDDSPWSLQTKTGRYAGEVRLILHYTKDNKPTSTSYAPPLTTTSYAPSAPPYSAPPQHAQPLYPTVPPTLSTYAPLPTPYLGPPPYSPYPPPPLSCSYPRPPPYVSDQSYPPPFYHPPPYNNLGPLTAYCCPPPPPGCYPRQYAPPPY